MKLRAIILGLTCVSFGACTTVNMTKLEGPGMSAAVPAQDNVVVKASNKLQAHFETKGWVDEPTEMKKAAMILLEGRNASSSASLSSAYSRSVTPDALKVDIIEATTLAGKTLKAADVYLQYVEVDRDLTPDLQSLESALLTCRKAEATFIRSSEFGDVAVAAELSEMSQTLTELQGVTDQYGDYVRAQKTVPLSTAAMVN